MDLFIEQLDTLALYDLIQSTRQHTMTLQPAVRYRRHTNLNKIKGSTICFVLTLVTLIVLFCHVRISADWQILSFSELIA